MSEVASIDGAVHYREAGQGMAVVMLHANLHDHHDFDQVFAPIAEHYRAIAVDWPSHGASSRVRSELSGPYLARVLREVVTNLGLGPSVFVGNSVGGYAAARLAIEQPDAVAGLVLVNSGGFTRHTPVTRAFCRILGHPAIARRVLPRLVGRYMKAQTDSDEQIASGVREVARTREGAKVGAQLWRSFIDPEYDLRGRAREITAPTLVLWGVQDVILPIKEGRAMHAAISGSLMHEFATGHVPFSSRPDEVLEVLMPFLATVAATEQGAPRSTGIERVDG